MQFADEFDDAILHRGAEYFRSGRVRIDSASTSTIAAAPPNSTASATC